MASQRSKSVMARERRKENRRQTQTAKGISYVRTRGRFTWKYNKASVRQGEKMVSLWVLVTKDSNACARETRHAAARTRTTRTDDRYAKTSKTYAPRQLKTNRCGLHLPELSLCMKSAGKMYLHVRAPCKSSYFGCRLA